MPKCAVKRCRNNTLTRKKTDGVTYHRFPQNDLLREKWRRIIAKERRDEFFKPNDSTVVCSSHFIESDIYTTIKGFKRLKKSALPQIKFDDMRVVQIQQKNKTLSIPLPSEEPGTSTNAVLPEHAEDSDAAIAASLLMSQAVSSRKIPSKSDSDSTSPSDISSIVNSPEAIFSNKELTKCHSRIDLKNRQLRELRKQNKRLMITNASIKQLLLHLKKRLADESLCTSTNIPHTGNMTITHLNIKYLRNRYVCSDHFDDGLIFKKKNGKKPHLSKNAVPNYYRNCHISPEPCTSQGHHDSSALKVLIPKKTYSTLRNRKTRIEDNVKKTMELPLSTKRKHSLVEENDKEVTIKHLKRTMLSKNKKLARQTKRLSKFKKSVSGKNLVNTYSFKSLPSKILTQMQLRERSEHSQDKSVYLDHNVQTVDSDYVSESYWESYTCNECNDVIKGGRFACAQCVDYDLCAQCAGERAAHRQHYLLRVPPRRPPDEVQRVLQTIRSILESEGATVAVPADGSEHKQTDTIKTEIKEEVDIFEEPLGCDVKQEVQEQGDDCETLKRVIVIPQSNDIEYTTKRKKRKTRDVTSTPPGTSQSSLVGGATAAADCTVPSVVKQEHEPSLRTPTITPSVPPPVTPPMPAVMYTSSQDEAEMALQAIRPTWKIGRAAVTLPANESEGEQTVPIKTEIIDEIEIFEEPLGCDVKQEVQEQGDNHMYKYQTGNGPTPTQAIADSYMDK